MLRRNRMPVPRRMSGFVLLLFAALGAAQAAPSPPSAPAYGIRIDEARIALPDGVRLSVDLYMPVGGEAGQRFPVLLEYLPYRKMEGRGRNYPLYSYFVQRGYVVAAVDIRGTGGSEGRLIPYEYSDIEHADGEVVIDWLARQPWSTGKVGMFGISWGGFNAIQMALRSPPALKAIIAVDATEDLYQEDVHFIDGIMHVDSWEMSQDLDNARPGAPDYVVDEAYFRDRFDTPPWMMTYKRQQRDGPFWDRASAKGRYADIRIPSLHIAGWYDGYRDSVPRMLAHVKAPVKAIIGPWSHAWPHEPYPEPGIEWRHEAVRWFDQWLKGVDTGIMDEPRFAVFVRNWHPPGPYLETAPGAWRYEDGWPIARIRDDVLHLQPDHTLAPTAPAPATHRLRYVPSIGVEAGGPVMWWGDVAHDQRPTDAYSLVYDSAPLSADTEILGMPRALLTVAADAPRANWFARISDIAPDGTVTQVAGAGFNGTHRLSARAPASTRPGRGHRARDRSALHVLGVPQGPSHPRRRQQFAMADALADALSDDDRSAIGIRRIARGASDRAACRAGGAGFPAARGKSEPRRLRYARCRYELGIRRDFVGRSQPADGCSDRHGHQHRRPAISLGRRTLPRDHPSLGQGRSTGQRIDAWAHTAWRSSFPAARSCGKRSSLSAATRTISSTPIGGGSARTASCCGRKPGPIRFPATSSDAVRARPICRRE